MLIIYTIFIIVMTIDVIILTIIVYLHRSLVEICFNESIVIGESAPVQLIIVMVHVCMERSTHDKSSNIHT